MPSEPCDGAGEQRGVRVVRRFVACRASCGPNGAAEGWRPVSTTKAGKTITGAAECFDRLAKTERADRYLGFLGHLVHAVRCRDTSPESTCGRVFRPANRVYRN